MFKYLLPNEATFNQSSRAHPHLQNSAYRPLAMALHAGVARATAFFRRLPKSAKS